VDSLVDPELVEIPPDVCPSGHSLRPPGVRVFWFGCACVGGMVIALALLDVR